jgi:hypothetical protein
VKRHTFFEYPILLIDVMSAGLFSCNHRGIGQKYTRSSERDHFVDQWFIRVDCPARRFPLMIRGFVALGSNSTFSSGSAFATSTSQSRRRDLIGTMQNSSMGLSVLVTKPNSVNVLNFPASSMAIGVHF